jgi:hypothetical protein
MTPTAKEKALITVELRLKGVHPEWVELWFRKWPDSLLDVYHRGIDKWWNESESRHAEWMVPPPEHVK